jgi:hypothetical protein
LRSVMRAEVDDNARAIVFNYRRLRLIGCGVAA